MVAHTLELSVYLKEQAGATGSVVSHAYVRAITAPLIARHVVIQDENHRGCHKRSWA
jgi:hypothetical protein